MKPNRISGSSRRSFWRGNGIDRVVSPIRMPFGGRIIAYSVDVKRAGQVISRLAVVNKRDDWCWRLTRAVAVEIAKRPHSVLTLFNESPNVVDLRHQQPGARRVAA